MYTYHKVIIIFKIIFLTIILKIKNKCTDILIITLKNVMKNSH